MTERTLRVAPAGQPNAFKSWFLMLGAISGAAATSAPDTGTWRDLPAPYGLLDDLVRKLMDAGVEKFYVPRASHFSSNAEALNAVIHGMLSYPNTTGSIDFSAMVLPARTALHERALQDMADPGVNATEALANALFGNTVQEADDAMRRFSALMDEPRVRRHHVPVDPASDVSPTALLSASAPGVISLPDRAAYYQFESLNRLRNPLTNVTIDAPEALRAYEDEIASQMERWDMFRNAPRPAAMVLPTESRYRLDAPALADLFGDAGYAWIKVELIGDVDAIVVAPDWVAEDFEKFADSWAATIAQDEALQAQELHRLRDALDLRDAVALGSKLQKLVAILSSIGLLYSVVKSMCSDQGKRDQAPPIADATRIAHTPPEDSRAKSDRTPRRRKTQGKQHSIDPATTTASQTRAVMQIATLPVQNASPPRARETDPKNVSRQTLERLSGMSTAEVDILLSTEVRDDLLRAVRLENAAGVSEAAGIMHGVIVRDFRESALKLRLKALDVDFYSVHQLVLDAITQHGPTLELRASLQLLLSVKRAALLASAALEDDNFDTLPVQGWQGPKKQTADASAKAAGTSTSAGAARAPVVADNGEDDESARLKMNKLHQFARRLAKRATPGGRAEKAGVVLGDDIFIPTAHLTPHIHIGCNFAVLKKTDGKHTPLVLGDVLQTSNLHAVTALTENDATYDPHLLEFLNYLAS